jgi:hypothetical protein
MNTGGRARRASAAGLGLLIAALAMGACGSQPKPGAPVVKPESVSVFDLRPNDCLNPPKANPNLDVSSVTLVPCRDRHVDEVYCVLLYSPTLPTKVQKCPAEPLQYPAWLKQYPQLLSEDYPSEQALTTYANAICLNEFQPYVGTPYTDSSLYYTYLYPSPQSWDDSTRRDRSVVCLLHATGAPLTVSAQGKKY